VLWRQPERESNQPLSGPMLGHMKRPRNRGEAKSTGCRFYRFWFVCSCASGSRCRNGGNHPVCPTVWQTALAVTRESPVALVIWLAIRVHTVDSEMASLGTKSVDSGKPFRRHGVRVFPLEMADLENGTRREEAAGSIPHSAAMASGSSR